MTNENSEKSGSLLASSEKLENVFLHPNETAYAVPR